MAATFASLALAGINGPLAQNYDKIHDGAKNTIKKTPLLRRKSRRDRDRDGDDSDQGYQSMDDYKYSSQRSGNPDRQGGRESYYYNESYASPRDERRYGDRDPRSGRHEYTPRSARRYESSSDSESSIPPRDRRRRNTVGQQDRNAALGGAAAGAGAYGAAQGYNGRRDTQEDRISRYTPQNQYQNQPQNQNRDEAKGGTERDNKQEKQEDSDSDSSSSVLPSSEDERQHKHIRTKELLTAGLAAVATIHAASGVYSSMEARDKRYEQLKSGKISPEDARKEKTKQLIQDFAAVGVAALSIKGAMSKWQGAAAQHKQRKEHKREKAERHEKRVEKARSNSGKSIAQGPSSSSFNKPSNGRPGYNRTYSTSEPDLSRRYENSNNGPRGPANYQNGNPYSPNGRR
ncbi:hypothetical protein MMC13_005167 [Lambiella insularis]|nr:hypothetical protein [Lambiella insularis]